MKALVQNKLGHLPEYQDIEIDSYGKAEVKLNASSLNHRDIWIIKGKYPGLRYPAILGSDGAGTFKESDVIINPSLDWGRKESHQGDQFRVLGMPDHGTFAQSIFIDELNIAPKPGHLDYYEAAALPLSGLTAYRALMVKCKPKQREKVLINGIGGGTATMAFLFALANENEVYVSSSSQEKIDKAVKLGAAGGVNYQDPNWSKLLQEMSGGVDVVIDSAAGPGFGDLLKVCNFAARIAIYGGTAGRIDNLSPQILFWKQISIHGTTMGSRSDFNDMVDLVSLHNITPIIHTVLPMSKADLAFAIMKEGKQFGKIVLDNRK